MDLSSWVLHLMDLFSWVQHLVVTWHSDPPPLPSLPLKTNPDHSRTPRAYPRILNSSRNLLSPPALPRTTLHNAPLTA